MNIKVKIYNSSKYNKDSQKVAEVEYKGCKGFEVREMTDDEIFALGFVETDEYKEYIFITFADGEIATFRNSICDIFKI